MIEIKHHFSGRVLFALECDSIKLCVEAAVKARANLAGAYLAGANLAGADLAGADLASANLARANLARVSEVIAAGFPDGWSCWAYREKNSGVLRVRVGCRDKTLAEGRAYWAGKDDRREVMATLDLVETIARLRGWEI